MSVQQSLRTMRLSIYLHLRHLRLRLRSTRLHWQHGRRVVLCDASMWRIMGGRQGFECAAGEGYEFIYDGV